MTRGLVVALMALTVAAVTRLLPAAINERPLSGSFTNWIDHPAIAYRGSPTTDPVAALIRRMNAEEVSLTDESVAGYLRSVLDALAVPVESQIAVFNKDSLQARRIERGNPRSIFFNDAVTVGWVRGGLIELASQDPQQGVVFYTLDRPLPLIGKPQIVRRSDCLTCHYSYDTVGVPGMLARSVGQTAVDHRLPLEQRWGGWYVTGQHGSIRHMGNADSASLFGATPPTGTLNWPSLDGKVNMTGYLSPHSDIVALMVFDHQMHGMNLLSRIGWEARVAAYQQEHNELRSADADAPILLRNAAREVVDYLLFVDEAALASPIVGSTSFAERFGAHGPWDHRGRSLRQLDLKQRLFRHRCSYLVDTDQFEHLPQAAREAIFERMWQILSGQERDRRYSRLTLEDRRAVVEILRDTKKDLPAYFRAAAVRS
jgi:hypothetical protein